MRRFIKKLGKSGLTAICFLAIVEVVFILNAFVPDREFSESENRMLQGMPEFSISQYLDGRYESKFEKYANDQMVFRDGFIKVKSAFDVARGVVESNGVYRSADNFLISDVTVPTDEELKSLGDALVQFKKAHPTLKMSFLLAPTAGNIYEDKLPFTVQLEDQDKYMDSLFNTLSDAGYSIIDVRDVFREKKGEIQLYYRTDHHWTSDGAYEAYKVAVPVLGFTDIVEYKPVTVEDDFRGTLYSKSGFTNGLSDKINIYLPVDNDSYKKSVIDYQDDSDKTTSFYNLDNLDKKDAYSVFGGGNHPMYTIKTPVASKKRLLLIKDSYANSMIPMLTQYYREIVVVDPRYYFDSIDELIDIEGITDVLFLYNADTFFADTDMAMMLNEK